MLEEAENKAGLPFRFPRPTIRVTLVDVDARIAGPRVRWQHLVDVLCVRCTCDRIVRTVEWAGSCEGQTARSMASLRDLCSLLCPSDVRGRDALKASEE